jgi:hypothetical protein
MRAGHFSLQARLSRFNLVPTAECECGDGLQTEEHILWDFKLYEDKRVLVLWSDDLKPEQQNQKRLPLLENGESNGVFSKKIPGRDLRGAWRQYELIGGKPSVIK